LAHKAVLRVDTEAAALRGDVNVRVGQFTLLAVARNALLALGEQHLLRLGWHALAQKLNLLKILLAGVVLSCSFSFRE